MDLMCRKGERVEFKIFAMLISFKTHCFRGEDDHLKAEINLFLLRFGGENHLKAAINLSCFAIQIATFPTGKIGVSLPRLPPKFPRSGNSLFAVEHGKYSLTWLGDLQ